MLVGRDGQRSRLEALLATARAGGGRTVVLRGEPGTGKTTLCDDVAVRADGCTVVRCRGTEAESAEPYAGLCDVVRPLEPHLAALHEPQATALRVAAQMAAGDAPASLAVGAGTLALLAAAAAQRPLVVVVDDLHWLDTPSRRALAFAARRLTDDPVGFVCSSRPDDDVLRALGEIPALEVLDLAPLDEHGVAALLEQTTATPAAPAVVRRVREATDGNPLAVREVAGQLSAAQLAGNAPIDDALAAPHAVQHLFAGRVAGLPAPASRALLLCVASQRGDLRELHAALSLLDCTGADLEAVEAAGLVTIGTEHVEPAHPLVRAAAVASSRDAPHRLRDAHRALAATVVDEHERTWHRALASVLPDEDIATALEHVAQAHEASGAYPEAARAWDRATELTPADGPLDRRLHGSARSRHLAGRFDDAVAYLDAALTATTSEHRRADIQQTRGHILVWQGRPEEARRLLVEEAERAADRDPVRAAMLLMQATVGALHAGRLDEAVTAADRAHEVSAVVGAPLDTATGAVRGFVRTTRGERDAEAAVLAARDLHDVYVPLAARQPIVLVLTSWLGQMLTVVEDLPAADAMLGRTVEAARDLGATAALPVPLAHWADHAIRTGNWPAAALRADESLQLADVTGQPTHRMYALVVTGHVELLHGQATEAREHLDEALTLARHHRVGLLELEARAALGRLELASDDPDAAAEHLDAVAHAVTRAGLAHGAMHTVEPDLVEALVWLGETARATEVAEQLTRRAANTRGRWPAAATARTRGLLCAPEAIDEHFGRALAAHAEVAMPFEAARTRLRYGERLRRTGRRRDARVQLAAALDVFDRLQAEPWARRAREELRATGRRIRDAEPGPRAQLTPQELRIALAVAEGATNREVAARVFLSPKTVENHLGRIYTKLQIRSRTELARAVAGSLTTAASSSSEPDRTPAPH